MEGRPHLTGDRRDPAGELRLERQTERARDGDRGEALRRVEQPADGGLGRTDALPEIAPAELARADGPQVDPPPPGDPVREGHRATQV